MKQFLLPAFATLAAMVVSCRPDIENPLPRENDPAVQAAVDAYVAEAAEMDIPINSIMIIRHGKVLAEAYVNGWSPRKPHHMWSTTKTFTSMAVGLAVGEGLLSLDDRMVDILSAEAAPVLDTITDGPGKEYLLSATIRDYLVMGNGQDADVMFAVCDKYGFPRWIDDKGKIIDFAFSTRKVNMITETFAQPFIYAPGTHNFYNNEGSHLLSCAVQKVTGEKVEDYLYSRLFEPLDIKKPFWDEIQGHTSGGWGLYLRPEDMAKFGLCLLNGGRFNGKQILPESYVREASQRYFSWDAPSWASPEEGRSYFQGYGYQIWMNSDAFCCSGAGGQFICMIPEYDMVIVATAEIRDDDHKEMALIWKHFLPVEIIRMSDFGLSAVENGNAAAKIQRAVEYGKTLGRPFEIQFEKGSYYLDMDDIEPVEGSSEKYLFRLDGCNGVSIDGGGSEFIFNCIAGFIRTFDSENIELRNFTIDWKRPYITQAVIRGCADNWMELEIDRNQYPYRMCGNRVRYICGDGEYRVENDSYCNYFTPQGRILPGSYDNYWMDDLLNGPAEEISDGVIRFYGKVEVPAPVGTILTIYNVRYRTSWASLIGGRNFLIRDVTVHHSLGCGVMASLVENLTLDNVDYVPGRDKGRVFSAVADAVHLTNCSGQFIMRNCDIDGQGDDALNVHGRYCKVEGAGADGRTFRFSTFHGKCMFRAGDGIWFVDRATLQRSREYEVVSSRLVSPYLFEITLSEVPDMDLGRECFAEAVRCPDVLIENNTFGCGNRARGILLTSHGKMVVRNNVFRSAGTAILVEGDLTYWHESGGVRDLTITGNVFDCCHTSQWGHSVISFSPSPVPEDDSLPRYHNGIRITGNKFRLIEPSVLYARYVGDLIFRDNEITLTDGYPPLGNMSDYVVLEHCRDCVVEF